MGTRIPSHQLSGGLYVSGRPEQHKERAPTMAARAVPYTGGDVKKSGELGKMFDIPTSGEKPPSSSSHNSGSARSASGSGPLPKPSVLQPTGLITSGPLSSSSSGPRRSGQADSAAGGAAAAAAAKPQSYGGAVTRSVDGMEFRIRVSRVAFWVPLGLFVTGLLVGIFMMVTVKKPIILFAVAGVLVVLVVLVGWNWCWGRRGLLRFLRKYPDAELRAARDGQFIKVTGV